MDILNKKVFKVTCKLLTTIDDQLENSNSFPFLYLSNILYMTTNHCNLHIIIIIVMIIIIIITNNNDDNDNNNYNN